MMGVAKGEPQILVQGRASDDGFHIRRTWPRAQPGRLIEALAEWEQGFGDRLGAIYLDCGFWRVDSRKFGAGGEPDAGSHRGEQIAALVVEGLPVERRPGRGAIMHVVAALDE